MLPFFSSTREIMMFLPTIKCRSSSGFKCSSGIESQEMCCKRAFVVEDFVAVLRKAVLLAADFLGRFAGGIFFGVPFLELCELCLSSDALPNCRNPGNSPEGFVELVHGRSKGKPHIVLRAGPESRARNRRHASIFQQDATDFLGG